MTHLHKTLGRRGALRVLAGSAAVAAWAPFRLALASEDAAAFPSRPVRFVIPFPPGSGAELSARFIGQKFTELMGQPVVVEPRGGGNGFIAVQAVLSAPRDGYTLFAGSSSTFAHNSALFKKLPYDPVADFVPLSMFIRSPVVLVVPANSPYRTLGEFITAAKQAPGKLSIGTGSAGYQMMGVLFAEMAGIQLLPVPYKSAPDTAKAVTGGEVSMGVADVTSSMPLIQSGRVRALAVGTDKRLPGAPEIPTASEQGLRGFNTAPWNGIMAPAGVPKPIVDKLADVFVRIMAMPETQEFFAKQNVEILPSGPEPMRTYQREEIERWKRIREVAKIEQQ
jgi:tripartite-type tricarboxylate transporter receptor subunit TctC